MSMTSTVPTRRVRLLAGAAVAGVLAGSIAAVAPAHAVVRDTDSVHIDGGKADFGGDPHIAGTPLLPGTVSWDHTSTVSARLTGRVYWDDAFSGGCARVRVQLRDVSGHVLGSTTSPSACRVGSGFVVSRPVDIRLSSPRAHRLVVTTQRAMAAGGAWENTASVTRYFGID